MTSQLIPFQFESSAIRVVMRNDDPWFVAADVCAALCCTTDQTRRLDDDEKGLYSIQTPGGNQELSIVNESGLYSLILTSRKPEAKKFKKWVTSEVLPSIRKTGVYSARPLTYLEILESALEAEKAHLATMAKLEQTQQENAALRTLTDQELGYSSILRAAKCIGVHESTFNWRPLKAMSKHLGLPVKRAPSSRYAYQLLYPIKAFEECYPNYDFSALTPEFLINQATTKFQKTLKAA